MLDQDTIEQLVIEHMTFKGKYLARERVDYWISELFSEKGLKDTSESHEEAFKQIDPIVQSLGYIPIKRGYHINPKLSI